MFIYIIESVLGNAPTCPVCCVCIFDQTLRDAAARLQPQAFYMLRSEHVTIMFLLCPMELESQTSYVLGLKLLRQYMLFLYVLIYYHVLLATR